MKPDTTLSTILADKDALRLQTAKKSFAAKLRILERIRDRDAAIRGPATRQKPPRGR